MNLRDITYQRKLNRIVFLVKEHCLSALLIVFFITEAFSKIYFYNFYERPMITPGIKLVFLIFCIVYLIKNRVKNILWLCIIAAFCIGQIFIEPNFDSTIVTHVVKYLFPVLLFSFFTHFKPSHSAFKRAAYFLVTMLTINAILILVGFLFDVAIFKTYRGLRFGYNGLFVSSATGTYAMSIGLFYLFFKYKSKFFSKIKVWLIFSSALLVGTKSIVAALFTLLILFLWYYIKVYKKLLIFSLISIFFAGVYLLFNYGNFRTIMDENGFLSALLSYRNELFLNKTMPFITEQWTPINYFFGGINDISTRPQMAFLDLFYFFGIVGGSLYLWSYYKGFKYFNHKDRKTLIFWFLLLSIIIISGNFFINASVAIYMLFLREYFIHKENNI